MIVRIYLQCREVLKMQNKRLSKRKTKRAIIGITKDKYNKQNWRQPHDKLQQQCFTFTVQSDKDLTSLRASSRLKRNKTKPSKYPSNYPLIG